MTVIEEAVRYIDELHRALASRLGKQGEVIHLHTSTLVKAYGKPLEILTCVNVTNMDNANSFLIQTKLLALGFC